MGIEMETRKYRLHGQTELLGSCTMDQEIYKQFIMPKANEGSDEEVTARNFANAQNDVNNIPIPSDEDEDKRATAFYRDEADHPILKAYQVKGFLKAACKSLSAQIGLKQSASKLDTFVFVRGTDGIDQDSLCIPLYRDGKRITSPEGFVSRPLRAQTMQGPRVSIATSEKVDAGWYCDIYIQIIENASTKTSCAVDFDVIETALDYGAFNGLLQWRNASYGSFTWERLE